MRPIPALSREGAAVVLALLDAARARAPEAPCAWLGGYAMRAAGEPLSAREAEVLARRGGTALPREEPGSPTPVGRVELIQAPLKGPA